MKTRSAAAMILIGGISLASLTGCEQIEQAANDAVQQAKQSAVKVLDEAKQSGSMDQAKQSANEALLNVKQSAADLLGQASEYLSNGPQGQVDESQPKSAPSSNL